MFVSNVGDSRAIVVSVEDGKLKARPLSSDQTPYRKDERERVKKYVLTMLRLVFLFCVFFAG
jgi:serine/threonine protein phosphatase PrpC